MTALLRTQRRRFRAPAEADGEGAFGGAAHTVALRAPGCAQLMLRCALPPQIFKFSVYVTIPVLLTVAFAGSPQNLQAIITNVRVQRWRTLARAAQDLRLHASRLAPCPHHSGRTWSIPPRGLVHRALRRFGRCVSADERVGVVSRRSARELAMLAMPHSRTLRTPYGHWKDTRKQRRCD